MAEAGYEKAILARMQPAMEYVVLDERGVRVFWSSDPTEARYVSDQWRSRYGIDYTVVAMPKYPRAATKDGGNR